MPVSSEGFGRFIGALLWKVLTTEQSNEYSLCDTYSDVLQCWKRPSGFTKKVLHKIGEGGQDPPINIITQPVFDE